MYLGRASIERAREHKKLASEVYVKGQRPPYIWEGPGTENATIVTSEPTVSATQPANVFVPESPDMLFSPEPVNENPTRNTAEQLTVKSKNVAKTSCQMKATTQPLLFQECATTSTANASAQVLSCGLKKRLVLLLFDWNFFYLGCLFDLYRVQRVFERPRGKNVSSYSSWSFYQSETRQKAKEAFRRIERYGMSLCNFLIRLNS